MAVGVQWVSVAMLLLAVIIMHATLLTCVDE
jgi:hypothetical protein